MKKKKFEQLLTFFIHILTILSIYLMIDVGKFYRCLSITICKFPVADFDRSVCVSSEQVYTTRFCEN